MPQLAHPVPAEEEQADQRRLEEKGHQAFNGQRRAENVAHIVGVIGPVHAELELHRDPGGHAQHEIDAEQRAPELRHVPPDLTARHHINALHDGEDDGQSKCERYKEEVIHGCQRELPARQLHNGHVDHVTLQCLAAAVKRIRPRAQPMSL
ncbi:hypothetical protein OA2633_07089 [Oceanicaulis sp. HTCC2633]|nr:hypothetical protein OA2633_07089 [Oceanicaulis sp. HTCC2633]